jgi:hypothetical protein
MTDLEYHLPCGCAYKYPLGFALCPRHAEAENIFVALKKDHGEEWVRVSYVPS